MRTQSLLVTAEVALSTVLLAASALLVASFARLLTVDTGLTSARVVFANVSASLTRYPEDAARAALYDRLLPSLRQIPGISTRRSCRSRRFTARRTSGRSASITTRGHSISGLWSTSASSIPATFHRWASR